MGPLGGQRIPQGVPKSPKEPLSLINGAQGGPQTPKMDPKRGPETPNWYPSDSPSSKMEPKRHPGQPPEMGARSPHDRTNIQTDAKTTIQQPTTQTTQIKRPGGMREATEYGGPPAGLCRVSSYYT